MFNKHEGFFLTVACFALMNIIVMACHKAPPSFDPTAVNSIGSKELADTLATSLMQDQKSEVYRNLEKSFRDSMTESDLDSVMKQMVQAYGRPIEFQFRQEEVGLKTYDDGTQKPLRTFSYAARTTKHEIGSHFLIVEVVPDDRRLAVSSFAIVNFPFGIPDSLR
jgi:hypothetical protein